MSNLSFFLEQRRALKSNIEALRESLRRLDLGYEGKSDIPLAEANTVAMSCCAAVSDQINLLAKAAKKGKRSLGDLPQLIHGLRYWCDSIKAGLDLLNRRLGVKKTEEALSQLAVSDERLQWSVAAYEERCSLYEHDEKRKRKGERYGPAAAPEPANSADADKPHWDGRKLTWLGIVIKEYTKLHGTNQAQILEAFQKSGWPDSVSVPALRGKLAQTVYDLNSKIKPRTIRFCGCGGDEKVLWSTNKS